MPRVAAGIRINTARLLNLPTNARYANIAVPTVNIVNMMIELTIVASLVPGSCRVFPTTPDSPEC